MILTKIIELQKFFCYQYILAPKHNLAILFHLKKIFPWGNFSPSVFVQHQILLLTYSFIACLSHIHTTVKVPRFRPNSYIHPEIHSISNNICFIRLRNLVRWPFKRRLHIQFLLRFGIIFGTKFGPNILLHRGTIFGPNKIPNF